MHLIKSVYEGSCVIELPNDEWKLFRGRENCIAFCMMQSYHEVDMNSTSENPTFLNAEFSKQVCLDLLVYFFINVFYFWPKSYLLQISLNVEKLEIKLRQKLVTQKNCNILPLKKPTNKEELEHFLRDVDSYRMCSGCPSVKYYRKTFIDCARKDQQSWRHVDCKLVVSNRGGICDKCLSLHARFSQTINYRLEKSLDNFLMTGQKKTQNINKHLAEKRRIKKDVTPQTKAYIDGLKIQRHVARQRLTRTAHRVAELRENLEELSNKINSLTDMQLEELIENIGLSKNEVITIQFKICWWFSPKFWLFSIKFLPPDVNISLIINNFYKLLVLQFRYINWPTRYLQYNISLSTDSSSILKF